MAKKFRPRYSSTAVTLDGSARKPKVAKVTKPRAEREWTFEELRGCGAYSSGREGWYE